MTTVSVVRSFTDASSPGRGAAASTAELAPGGNYACKFWTLNGAIRIAGKNPTW